MAGDGAGSDDYGGFNYSFTPSFSTGSGDLNFGSGSSSYAPASGGVSGFNASPAGGAISSSFAPSPGVDLGGGQFPDPTSASYGAGESTDFSNRFQASYDAESSGEFNPVGSNAAPGNMSGGTPVPYTNTGLPSGGPGELPFGGLDFASLNASLGGAPDVAPGLPGVGTPPSQADSGGGFGGDGNDRALNIHPSGSPAPVATAQKASVPSVGGGGTFLDKITAGAANSIAKNPLGILAAGAGLGINLLKGNKDPEGLDQVRAAAANLNSTGSVLQQYLQTGTLPAGMQASVELATKAARARIIQNHATRGLSTDTNKNSALQQELAQLDQNAIITAATLGDKLMTQGLSATGMANQLYTTIMQMDRERQKATGQAITNFAAALGGGGGSGGSGQGINLKIG